MRISDWSSDVCSSDLCVVLGRWFPLPETEDMNLDLKGFHEPATAVPVRGRTGPVVVTIEYRIADEDTYAFLSALAVRSPVRRRNGARRGRRGERRLGQVCGS